jgi:predicted NAD/FAD-dependent oxidoreductase
MYQEKSQNPAHRFAVIGAGLAGLSCARVLVDAGHAVTLWDKGRGPGGRLATRRVETPLGQVRFDHGAQYLTARDPAFQALAAHWQATGLAAQFPEPLVHIGADLRVGQREAASRFIGVPGNSALAKALGEGLDVRFSAKVDGLTATKAGWQLGFEAPTPNTGPDLGPYDQVILAVPAEQIGALIADHDPILASEASAAVTGPTWSVMVAFDAPIPVAFHGASLEHPILGWIARENAKPGRAAIEAWTLHANPDWSLTHCEDTPERVSQTLIEAFIALSGATTPIWHTAHRWRYARVEQPALTPFRWNRELGLAACGDWRIGARGEAAWLSGRALARAIVAELTA